MRDARRWRFWDHLVVALWALSGASVATFSILVPTRTARADMFGWCQNCNNFTSVFMHVTCTAVNFWRPWNSQGWPCTQTFCTTVFGATRCLH